MFAIARTVEEDGDIVKLAIVYTKTDGVTFSKEDPDTGEILESLTYTAAEADVLYDMLLMTYAAVTQRR